MRRILVLTALFCAALTAFGQAVRVDIPLLTAGPNVSINGTPLPTALWLSNATIQICTHPATLSACSYITTYTDSTEGTSCPGTQQIVNLPGNTCSSLSGTLGNIGFWYAGGTVDYIITSSYGTFGPYSVSSGTGGSSCSTFSCLATGTIGVPVTVGTGGSIVTSGAGTIQATSLTGNITESQVTNLVTDLAARALTTTTVNGHALSSNVVISASDITTGTLPVAQSPNAPVTVTTTASVTTSSGYYYNQDATTAAAITYTLPTPVAGKQICTKNSNTSGTANTGTLEMIVANTGTQSIIYNGSVSASGFIQSSGVAGDSACVVAISTTQWEAYVSVGTWTLH